MALLLGLALMLACLGGVASGVAGIDVSTVARILVHAFHPGVVVPDWSAGTERIVLELRLPRVALGVLVGAGLAVTGLVLQATTRNPLADPYLFGVSAGASVGAVIVIAHTGEVVGPLTLPLAAFAGALLSILAVAGVTAGSGGMARDRLVLAGVAVSFVLMAVTHFLIFLGDQRAAHSVVFWTLGGLGLARPQLLVAPLIVVACGIVAARLVAGWLDALLLGDEAAQSLGLEVARFRLVAFTGCALVTGVLVAVAGSIGFVGLMVPHLARWLVGARHAWSIPIAALLGALLVTSVDILARVVLAPQELPIGIVTGALGGLFFVGLMRRSGGMPPR